MHLLFSGVDAVLGPANITKDDQIPIEQCISTSKLKPGSGCLGVNILADGPTRVLQITDCLLQVTDPVHKLLILSRTAPSPPIQEDKHMMLELFSIYVWTRLRATFILNVKAFCFAFDVEFI